MLLLIFFSFVVLCRMIARNNIHTSTGNCCKSCMTRIPYATMIATVMCLIGVAIFCITMYRGASLTIIMFDQVFHFRLFWIEAVQMIFVAIGASMAALGFMILFVGCLATGSTRYKVYRAWRSRVGGRISCAVVGSCLLWFFVWFFSWLQNRLAISKLCSTFFVLYFHQIHHQFFT